MRYMFLRFPEGKFKAVTLSYDDGVYSDVKFAEIIGKHGLKCTFNINSGNLNGNNPRKLSGEQIKTKLIDSGHEVAVHGKLHIAPANPIPSVAIKDILDCRIEMENAFGIIVRGMAYPDTGIRIMSNGNSYDNIKGYLKNLGIVYARTLGGDNDSFTLPDDFHAWMPTAHHNNPHLIEWAEKFTELKEADIYLTRKFPRLFYLWGHTYEFDKDDNWDVIEKFCETIAGKEDTWYATNIEIYEYIEAYNSLVYSADGSKIYNPTLKEIWIFIDGTTYSIKPGETLKL